MRTVKAGFVAATGASRGQVSLEYLLIAIVILALLGISLAALVEIRSAADQSYARILFGNEAEQVANLAEQLCLLGPGNTQEMKLEDELDITYQNGEMQIKRGNWRYTKEMYCEVEAASLNGRIVLENKNHRIAFRS